MSPRAFARWLHTPVMAMLLVALLVVSDWLPAAAAWRIRAAVDAAACEAGGACVRPSDQVGSLAIG